MKHIIMAILLLLCVIVMFLLLYSAPVAAAIYVGNVRVEPVATIKPIGLGPFRIILMRFMATLPENHKTRADIRAVLEANHWYAGNAFYSAREVARKGYKTVVLVAEDYSHSQAGHYSRSGILCPTKTRRSSIVVWTFNPETAIIILINKNMTEQKFFDEYYRRLRQ